MLLKSGFNGCKQSVFAALFLALGLALATTKPALADLGAAARSVPSAELVGKGRLTYFGFKVYDAELYAPRGNYLRNGPFALKLTYLRNFKGSEITKSSLKEISRQGSASSAKLDTWASQLRKIFPDVRAGQSITGVRKSDGRSVFYLGNRKLGTISDPEFSRAFFSIWLGNSTRDPKLRARLLGKGS